MDFPSLAALFSSKILIMTAIFEKASVCKFETLHTFLRYNGLGKVLRTLNTISRANLSEAAAEIETFLLKAKEFKNLRVEYSAWWPDERPGVMIEATTRIFFGSAGPEECFALVVGLLKEALETIKALSVPSAAP